MDNFIFLLIFIFCIIFGFLLGILFCKWKAWNQYQDSQIRYTLDDDGKIIISHVKKRTDFYSFFKVYNIIERN